MVIQGQHALKAKGLSNPAATKSSIHRTEMIALVAWDIITGQ